MIETPKFDPWAAAEVWRELSATASNEESAEYKTASKKWLEQYQLEKIAEDEYVYSDLAALKARPLFQKLAAERCLDVKHSIEQGDDSAVIEAIAECFYHGLNVPAWLSSHFIERYNKVITGELRDWSDKGAFGNAHPKNANKKGTFAYYHIAPEAYKIGVELLSEDPERPIDKLLYEDIAEKLPETDKKLNSTRLLEIIKVYLDDGFMPPFVFVKQQLKNGLDVMGVAGAWDKLRHEKLWVEQGYVVCEDGVSRHISTLGIPETSKLSGFTTNTLNSSIEPLQPKGKLNDIPRAKSKPSRTTAKTSRS
jgi:hypothetical protein